MCKDRKVQDSIIAEAKRDGSRVFALIEDRDGYDDLVGIVKWFDSHADEYEVHRNGSVEHFMGYDHVPNDARAIHRRLRLDRMTRCVAV